MAIQQNNTGYDGQNLPYNLEAEQSVLGSILMEPSSLTRVAQILKADHFHIPQHRAIYANMQLLDQSSKPIDFITVLEALRADGVYDEAGGKAYLLQLLELVPSVANVEAYAKIVQEKHDIRALITASREIIDSALDGQTDSGLLLDAAEQRIFDIRQGRDTRSLRPMQEIIVEAYDRLHQLNSDNRDDYLGIPTGLSGVDAITTGLNKSDLIVLGARPGMGKTSFALNVARNVALTKNKTVCFFSLEMSCEQLASRMLSTEAKIPSTALRTGRLSTEEWNRLGKAASVLSGAQLLFDDTSGITVAEIKAKLRRQKKVDLVVIDYLQLMTPSKSVGNRVQEVSEMTRNLKIMAKDLRVPVITLSQLRRASESHREHRPQLADLRESGSIEQDADIVMFLHRNDYYNDGEEGQPANPNEAELIIAKNRHGATDSIPLHWEGQFTRFTTEERVLR